MQIISNITTPHPSVSKPSPASENPAQFETGHDPGPHGASISHPGWSRAAMCLELQPRLVGQIGPSGWGRKTHGRWTKFLEVSEKCWLASMCIHMYIYIHMYLFMYLCDYLFCYLCVYLFMCIYIYVCVCVCFHGKIDKYDDVWWFSRKPYLISGGYGTKWNVLVAIIQHQMQEKFSWTRTASVTSYYRFNKMESSPGKAVPLNQTCLGHIWTSCVWQAGYKS
jgi:hypothetical protein